MDQTVQSLVTDVEKELLQTIINNLREDRMDVPQARALAKEFLTLLPMQDKHDLLTKLLAFSQKHVEAKSMYLKVAVPAEEEERLRKIEEMSKHIQAGNIEHALTVAKGGAN